MPTGSLRSVGDGPGVVLYIFSILPIGKYV